MEPGTRPLPALQIAKSASPGARAAGSTHDAPIPVLLISRKLIVDEDPEVHRVLKCRLEARNCVVDYARDQAEATARLTDVMPDVLFLNVPAPGPRPGRHHGRRAPARGQLG